MFLSRSARMRHASPQPADTGAAVRLLRICRDEAGSTLIELLVASALIVLSIITSTSGLLSANRHASATRVFTAARAIVQRNIDTALSLTFDAAITPAILATTPTSGQVYDDDGGGDNKVQIVVQQDGGAVTMVTGTLTRTVTAQANPQGADIRRINFRIAYAFRGKNYSYEMSTVRAIDD